MSLRKKIADKYGNRVSFLDQSNGPGFVCASSVPLGDSLRMLHDLEKQSEKDKEVQIIRKDLGKVRAQQMQSTTLEVSEEAVGKIFPDSLRLFTSCLHEFGGPNTEVPMDQAVHSLTTFHAT